MMEPTQYPQQTVDFIMRRRGRLHIYESLDPAKTALMVVDMQRAFVAEGAAIETAAARGIVPNINRLAETQSIPTWYDSGGGAVFPMGYESEG